MSGGTSAAMMATSLALATASAIATDQGQRADARSQKAYQEAQMRAHQNAAMQNANSAIKEQVEKSAAERQQQMQQNEAGAREMQKHRLDYLQKKGAAVASSEYGSGLSFEGLMADYNRAYGMNRDVTQQQLDMYAESADHSLRAYRDEADSRIKSQRTGFMPAPIRGPNTLATALSLGGEATGIVRQGYKDGVFDKPTPDPKT